MGEETTRKSSLADMPRELGTKGTGEWRARWRRWESTLLQELWPCQISLRLLEARARGVTAPACLRKSSRLGYDKNSVLIHSLQSFYVCGWCMVNELKISQWELDVPDTSSPKRSALACAHTSIPLPTCKRVSCFPLTILWIRNASKANTR